MSGIIHQLPKKHLFSSTKFFREFNLAQAEFNLGKVALGDLLVSELSGSSGSIGSVLHHMDRSISKLREAARWSVVLRSQMYESDYKDITSLYTIDWDFVKRQLVGNGLIGEQMWDLAITCMVSHGFYGMLNFIDGAISALSVDMAILHEQCTHLRVAAENGQINAILTENRKGNFRSKLSCVSTNWSKTDQLLLASDLIIAETRYDFEGLGSIMISQSEPIAP